MHKLFKELLVLKYLACFLFLTIQLCHDLQLISNLEVELLFEKGRFPLYVLDIFFSFRNLIVFLHITKLFISYCCNSFGVLSQMVFKNLFLNDKRQVQAFILSLSFVSVAITEFFFLSSLAALFVDGHSCGLVCNC